MKIRRYIADNIQDAVKQARIELGRDAMIIQTRKFKQGGFLGFFARPRVEVTVALDDGIIAGKVNAAATACSPSPEPMPSLQVTAPVGEPPRDNLLDELISVKQMVAELNNKIDDQDKLNGFSGSMQRLYKMMLANNVNENLALRIVNIVNQKLELEDNPDTHHIQEICYEVIQNLFIKPKPIEYNRGQPRVVAMIGPTGVGKTTTIAKLAANFSLLQKRQVGLITIDTYRIAAVEQLKTYAEIIGIPLEVVFQPEGLKTAINKHRNRDLIFIDTAGRSPKNELQISELADFLRAANPDEIILVLNTSTYTSDMLEVYRRFNVLRIDKLIFTKIDECEQFGQILNVVHDTRTNLAYITNGQNVPDDIEVPDISNLAKMILGEGMN